MGIPLATVPFMFVLLGFVASQIAFQLLSPVLPWRGTLLGVYCV